MFMGTFSTPTPFTGPTNIDVHLKRHITRSEIPEELQSEEVRTAALDPKNILSSKTAEEPQAEDVRAAALDLKNILSKNKQTDRVDFNQDPDVREKIDLLFDSLPGLFDYQKKYSWDAKESERLIEDLKTHFNLATDPEYPPLQQIAAPFFAQDPPEQTKKTAKKTPKDVHLGLAFLSMQNRAHEINEAKINVMINQLTRLNAINKDLSDLTCALTACKESGKADFTQDSDLKAIIDRLYEVNPKIFNNQKTYSWNSANQIDVVLSALDAEVKTKISETNQVTMMVHLRFDERIQFNESARETIEMLNRHNESIISKYNKN